MSQDNDLEEEWNKHLEELLARLRENTKKVKRKILDDWNNQKKLSVQSPSYIV